MNFKRLSLTDIKVEIPRMPKKTQLADAMEAAGNDLHYKWLNDVDIHPHNLLHKTVIMF